MGVVEVEEIVTPAAQLRKPGFGNVKTPVSADQVSSPGQANASVHYVGNASNEPREAAPRWQTPRIYIIDLHPASLHV